MTDIPRTDDTFIEAKIYDQAANDPGFAIAYALIQVAAALNSISGEISGPVRIDTDAILRSMQARSR